MASHSRDNHLRALRHVYTANDPLSRQAVFTKVREGAQTTYSEGGLAIDTIYGASTLDTHPGQDSEAAARSALGAGAASPGGTVCRVVDFAPLHECAMSRGQNLDYAAVIEGSIVLSLDSGQETRLERGDVAVQRAASHVWRNPSKTEWARVFFVLQDSSPTTPSSSKCYI
ncbi:hypothetical protein HRG_001118 [Hirsutella rhossiliensis]|uniref:Uncharacterized protein n=1 Tax=Hirsutella rhossiliensis TaxID=111463 RepID=A0A9P8SMX8_9HYPO|nr:uncharacterized protein HRG_01118 [Hirsutella rhossiliensis]KAH0968476.1 hypothetical protein HRG_01118 [Hirsutella rhossiliensis]